MGFEINFEYSGKQFPPNRPHTLLSYVVGRNPIDLSNTLECKVQYEDGTTETFYQSLETHERQDAIATHRSRHELILDSGRKRLERAQNQYDDLQTKLNSNYTTVDEVRQRIASLEQQSAGTSTKQPESAPTFNLTQSDIRKAFGDPPPVRPRKRILREDVSLLGDSLTNEPFYAEFYEFEEIKVGIVEHFLNLFRTSDKKVTNTRPEVPLPPEEDLSFVDDLIQSIADNPDDWHTDREHAWHDPSQTSGMNEDGTGSVTTGRNADIMVTIYFGYGLHNLRFKGPNNRDVADHHEFTHDERNRLFATCKWLVAYKEGIQFAAKNLRDGLGLNRDTPIEDIASKSKFKRPKSNKGLPDL